MTVYVVIVSYDEWSDSHVIGVFSTIEKAKAVATTNFHSIEEYQLDAS